MMLQRYLQILMAALLLNFFNPMSAALADDQTSPPRLQEEVWALPLPLPMFAYVVRPVGDGPFPLVIMRSRPSAYYGLQECWKLSAAC